MYSVRFHQYGGPEVLRLDTVPVPAATAGKVLIQVEAAGLNAADILERTGCYIESRPLPVPSGLEVAGTVVSIGDGVVGLELGQQVMGFARGSLSEFALTIPALLFPIPTGMSFNDAAALPLQGLTAYLALTDAGKLGNGESVLVQGAAGGVGLLAVQLARVLGASKVVATAASEDKRKLTSAFGSDLVFDYRDPGFADRVREDTAGLGVDVVLDGVGGEVIAKSLAVLARRGRLVFYGQSSGATTSINPYQLVKPSHSIHGFSLQAYLSSSDQVREAMKHLSQLASSGQIRQIIGGIFALKEYPAAFSALEDRDVVGKIVVGVGQGT